MGVSNLGHVTKSTPQGSLMGPFMYNIVTNDLLLTKEKVQHCSILTVQTTTTQSLLFKVHFKC